MKHRTALIVAASIAAVVLAAALAVAVNLGILTAADSSPVGQLTTATVAQAAGTKAAAAYQPETQAPAAPVKKRQTQDYVIQKAGAVRVAFSDKAVRFVDATAKDHWTWKLSQTTDRKLTVTFEHGADTYTFVAQVGDHGKVTARVDHPVTQVAPSSGGSTTWTVAPAPAAAASPASGEPGEGTHTGGQEDD